MLCTIITLLPIWDSVPSVRLDFKKKLPRRNPGYTLVLTPALLHTIQSPRSVQSVRSVRSIRSEEDFWRLKGPYFLIVLRGRGFYRILLGPPFFSLFSCLVVLSRKSVPVHYQPVRRRAFDAYCFACNVFTVHVVFGRRSVCLTSPLK